MKVWLVYCIYNYEERRIFGIFNNEKKAQKLFEKIEYEMKGDSQHIEEIELNKELVGLSI